MPNTTTEFRNKTEYEYCKRINVVRKISEKLENNGSLQNQNMKNWKIIQIGSFEHVIQFDWIRKLNDAQDGNEITETKRSQKTAWGCTKDLN